jgi:sarcosine oxidase subunit alpha
MDKSMDDDAIPSTAGSHALKGEGGFRLAAGGAIDRARTLRFTFNGQAFTGHPGDTLASALLANGVRSMGLSRKDRRPRGLVSAGPDEPCAFVTLRGRHGQEPGVPAAIVELFDGLEAVGHDGDAAWRPEQEEIPDPALWRELQFGGESAVHADCDVLVIGSGLAGLSAARAAAGAGARVILLEQDSEAGGGALVDPALSNWRAETLEALRALPDARLITRAAAVGASSQGLFAAIERVSDPAEPMRPRRRLHLIRPRKAILASGAAERLVAFPDNDRPGVMLATAARTWVNRFGAGPGRRAVFFVNNDEAYAAMRDLAAAGIAVAAVVDPRGPTPISADAKAAGFPVLHGHEVAGVAGRAGVSGAAIRRVGELAASVMACDLLCVSGGYTPRIALSAQAGQEASWNEAIAGFAAPDGGSDFASAGAAAGCFGRREAAEHGARMGAAAAAACGFASAPAPHLPPVAAKRDAPILPLWEVKAAGKAYVDLRRDVTADDMRRAASGGDGWSGNLLGSAVLAEALGLPIAALATPVAPAEHETKRTSRP